MASVKTENAKLAIAAEEGLSSDDARRLPREKLGINIQVCSMNEGHAAFAVVASALTSWQAKNPEPMNRALRDRRGFQPAHAKGSNPCNSNRG